MIESTPPPPAPAPVYEYEIWNAALEPYFDLPRFTNKQTAEDVAHRLSLGMGIGFVVRDICLNKEPLPPKAATVSHITVHEARKMGAKHGMDLLVVIGWSKEDGRTNIVTAGSNREFSESALELGNKIAAGMGMNLDGGFIEDRRDEHKT